MAEITASTVKALREETGLGMMDCKKALQETDGDLDAARDILRKKGLATAAKKAGRTASEGLVAISAADDGTAGAMVEISCETDFCARNEVFKELVQQVADKAAESDAGEVGETDEITHMVQQTLAKIGENMSFARGVKVVAPKVGAYLHHNGKVGVLVGVDSDKVTDEVLADVCMHVAFSDPMGVTPEDIPDELVESEKQIAKQQAIDSGKPEEIAEKIVTGKMRKFLEERALMEQQIAREDKYGKKRVKEVLDGANVTSFARFAVGESS